jgi:site-specific DNA-methyltransferase (adenine-specific)
VINKSLFSSHCQTWRTPKAVYQTLDAEFRFDFDPCPPNPQFDGLAANWGRRNFVNPPYKTIEAWIRKGFDEWSQGKTVVFLIPSRTDTGWWHDCVMQASEIRFIRGRLRFEGANNNAPFPSAIVVFRAREVTDGES